MKLVVIFNVILLQSLISQANQFQIQIHKQVKLACEYPGVVDERLNNGTVYIREVMEKALTYPTVEQAEIQKETSEQILERTKGNLRPRYNVGVGADDFSNPDFLANAESVGRHKVSIGGAQLLYAFGAAKAEIESAKINYAIAVEGVKQASLKAALQGAQNFVGVLSIRESMDALIQNYNDHTCLASEIESKPNTEIYYLESVQGFLKTAEAKQNRQSNQSFSAEADFKQYINERPDYYLADLYSNGPNGKEWTLSSNKKIELRVPGDDNLTEGGQKAEDAAVEAAMAIALGSNGNPNYKMAEYMVNGSQFDIKRAKRNKWGRVFFEVGLVLSQQSGDLAVWDDTFGSRVSLGWGTSFGGGAHKTAAVQAINEQSIRKLNVEIQKRTLQNSLEKLYHQLRSYKELLAVLKSGVESRASDTVKKRDRRFEDMPSSLNEYLQARNELSESLVVYNDLEFTALLQKILIQAQMGTLLTNFQLAEK